MSDDDQTGTRVKITVDLLEWPEAADPNDIPASLHKRAWEEYSRPLEEQGLTADMENTRVTYGYLEDPDQAAIGRMTYYWIFYIIPPTDTPDAHDPIV